MIELGSCAFRQPGATHSHCSKLHGYQLKAKFWFSGSELDQNNWMVDFGGLKELKALLQNQFDHTVVVCAQDPLLHLFKQLHEAGGCELRIMEQGVGIERTAEYCFNLADKYIRESTQGRCWVDKVEVFEHELNSATYSSESVQATNLAIPLQVESSTVAEQTVLPVTRSTGQPASVGNITTSGKGDWFAGTTWA